jgi:hypothetical protein
VGLDQEGCSGPTLAQAQSFFAETSFKARSKERSAYICFKRRFSDIRGGYRIPERVKAVPARRRLNLGSITENRMA